MVLYQNIWLEKPGKLYIFNHKLFQYLRASGAVGAGSGSLSPLLPSNIWLEITSHTGVTALFGCLLHSKTFLVCHLLSLSEYLAACQGLTWFPRT